MCIRDSYTDVIITIILYFIILHNKYFILVLFVVILTNFSHITIFFINISCFIFLCHYIWYTWCDYLITKKRPFSCQFKKRHCSLWCSSHKSNDASFSGAKYLLTAASETALCPHITGCADGIIRLSVFVGKMIGICHTDRSVIFLARRCYLKFPGEHFPVYRAPCHLSLIHISEPTRP